METYIIAGAAVIAVLATSLVKNVEWTTKTKHLVATGVSSLLAAVLFLTSDLGDVNFIVAASSVHGLSQVIYNFVFKGLPLNGVLERAVHGDNNTEL